MNCSLCLQKSEDSVPIFANNADESLWKSVFQYLHLKSDDLHSINLCPNCTRSLQDFHNFYQCVQKCQSSWQPTQQVPTETSVQWDIILRKASVLEKSKTCRLCIQDCEDAVSIATDKNEKNWLQWISKYLFMKIEPNDIHASSICPKCIRHLQDFHNFFQYVQDCQLTLKNMNSSENTAKTNTDSNENGLIVKKETDEEFQENDGHESCNDIAALEQIDECQRMHQCFSDVLVKTEEESDTCENDESLENFKETECKQFQEVDSNTSDDMKNRTCFACSKVFETIVKAKKHMYHIHNKKNEVIENRTCSICSKVISTVKGLKEHMRLRHNTMQEAIEHRKCRICTKVFETTKKMKMHTNRRHNSKDEDIANRTCSICSAVLSTVRGLRDHMLFQHRENQEAIEHRTCRICSKIYDTIRKRKEHIRRQHNKKHETIGHHICQICSKVFETIKKMKMHTYRRHNSKDGNIANRTCSICSAVLSTVRGLKDHMLFQHREKQEAIEHRTCGICSKVYDTIRKRKEHMRRQHNEKPEAMKPRTCRICSKAFDKKIQLDSHMSNEHKDSEEASIVSKKQNAETEDNASKLSIEKSHTKEEQYPVEFRVKEEEPLEIDDFLEE